MDSLRRPVPWNQTLSPLPGETLLPVTGVSAVLNDPPQNPAATRARRNRCTPPGRKPRNSLPVIPFFQAQGSYDPGTQEGLQGPTEEQQVRKLLKSGSQSAEAGPYPLLPPSPPFPISIHSKGVRGYAFRKYPSTNILLKDLAKGLQNKLKQPGAEASGQYGATGLQRRGTHAISWHAGRVACS